MTLESQTILLAISAAFVSSATNIAFAPALRQMGSFALAQVNNLGNSLMLGAIGFWMYEPGSFRWEAFAWFSVLGVVNYSINRWVFYTGMNAIGPSRHITITSMVPLPSLFLAVIFLGEEPGRWVLARNGLVVLGVVAVSYEPSGGRWFRTGISWSLMSMLMLVASAFMRKQGMSYMAAPALLTAWSAFVAIPTSEGLRHFLPARYFEWGSKRYIPVADFRDDHQRVDANPHQPLPEGQALAGGSHPEQHADFRLVPFRVVLTRHRTPERARGDGHTHSGGGHRGGEHRPARLIP